MMPLPNANTISSHLFRRPDFCKIPRMKFFTTCSVVPIRSAIVLFAKPAHTSTRTLRSLLVNARKTSRPRSVMARSITKQKREG
jgi:hypothetical protein